MNRPVLRKGNTGLLFKVIRLISEHPIAAGGWAILFLTLPSLITMLMPASQVSGLLMLLVLPLQALAPLPIFLVSLRRGLKEGVFATLLLVAGSILLSQEIKFPLLVLLLIATYPLLAAWMLHKGWNFSQSAVAGFLLGLLILSLLLLMSTYAPLDMEKSLLASFNAMRDRLVVMAQNQGAGAAAIHEHQRSLEQLFNILVFLFPSLLVSGWFLLQLINLVITRHLFAKWFGYPLPEENFARFRVPFFMVWPVIAFGLIMMLLNGPWYRFSANMCMFLAIPYFFQGLAVIQAMFQHLKVPVFWQNVFYVFIFWSSKTALVIIVLGFFDTWLNVRIRLEKTGEGGTPSGR
ncbi:MAG: DUF2232 domain-containing protein [Magnetococcales bacterium]|nr:DUF2232 domain-containing protein [Magnetococcales bacterium]